jgi:hypothetical protein
MPKVKRIRDLSLALSLARMVRDHGEDGQYSPLVNNQLVEILDRLDARKGGREKGQGAALSPLIDATPATTQRRGVRKPR